MLPTRREATVQQSSMMLSSKGDSMNLVRWVFSSAPVCLSRNPEGKIAYTPLPILYCSSNLAKQRTRREIALV